MKILISFLQPEDTTSPNNKWKAKEKIVTQATTEKQSKAVRIYERKRKAIVKPLMIQANDIQTVDIGNEPEGGSYTQGEFVTEEEDYKLIQ